MEKRKVIKTIERSCRSGKILSARWTCDWGCMAGDIHNNTITYFYIHHHKISQNNNTVTYSYIHRQRISMHGRFQYIHPQDIDHFCSLKTNRWLLDNLLSHLKKSFFCLNFRPVVGFPVKQPITSAESPVFTITNHKGKHQIKIR